MASKDPKKEISPKVKHGSNAGLIITLLTGITSVATDQFGGALGDYAAPLGALLAVIVFTVVGYLKGDPKRIMPNVKRYLDQ